MLSALRHLVIRWYETSLEREITSAPKHVAVIQDGNRRYAHQAGRKTHDGHREGAKTTERVLRWCYDLDIEELTLYSFSTENLNRPQHEREAIYDLLVEKLYDFADSEEVLENEVRIRALGEVELLPARVQRAVEYAEEVTATHDRFKLNIALAYGGRTELLHAIRDVASAVKRGELAAQEIDVEEIEHRLYNTEVRDVDLIIRTGGDERTSNFLPWHANGNEAAVFFCTPYWPEFRKIDFLRAVRTYESREASWQQTKVQRAVALLRALSDVELPKAQTIANHVTEEATVDPAGRRGENERAETKIETS